MASAPEEHGPDAAAVAEPGKRYTRGSASNAPARKRQSGQRPEKAAARRKADRLGTPPEPAGPRVMNAPERPKNGGRLRGEILLPLAVGTLRRSPRSGSSPR